MLRSWPIAALFVVVAAQASASDVDGLDGAWRTDGYGYVVEVAEGTVRVFNIAGSACVPETPQALPLETALPGISLDVAEDGRRLTVRYPFEPHPIGAERVLMSTVCRSALPATPDGNFDAFAGFFEESYPFFDLHGVDWQVRVDAARTQLRADMSDRALFDLLSGLIAPIGDGHVGLAAWIDGARHRFAADRGRTQTAIMQAAALAGEDDPEAALEAFHRRLWIESIPQRVLEGDGRTAAGGRIHYGLMDGDVGYLALLTVGGFDLDAQSPGDHLSATHMMLDEVFGYFNDAGARSLIVDLSLNFGGEDHIAREIAGRFATEPVMAYSKFAADAAEPIVTELMIVPSENVRFDGEVALLTSNVTMSAGEVLALSLRALPHVTHVGEPTRGALSDALEKTLPNGWMVQLSNETYLDAEGRHWEGRGIMPDRAITVFAQDAPVKSHARAVAALSASMGR